MSTRPDVARMLNLVNPDAERAVVGAMLQNANFAVQMAQELTPADFHDARYGITFEAIVSLLRGIEPIDASAVVAEARHVAKTRKMLEIKLVPEWVTALIEGEHGEAIAYAQTVRRLSWLRRAGEFAMWLGQELQTNPQPNDLYLAAQERWQALAPRLENSDFVYGWQTTDIHEAAIKARIEDAQAGHGQPFAWPWASWTQRIRPLRAGMVGIIAAPDGVGKTTYLEYIAESWARQGQHTVYVHLEDELEYKLDRRLCRHAGILLGVIEDGRYTAEQLDQVTQANRRIGEFAGCLHYYHAAGKSMAEIVRELETRIAEGVCSAVVFDYLDKVQANRTQVRLFGDNGFERQANDMEQLKTFAERNGVPVITATQGNKEMQGDGIKTRKAIQGSGQKSQKAQLVVILTRDIVSASGGLVFDGQIVAEQGEYSPVVHVRIDKQNRGKTGDFEQILKGEFYRIADYAGARK